MSTDYCRALGEVARDPSEGGRFREETVTQFSDANMAATLLKCTKVSLNLQCALLALRPVRSSTPRWSGRAFAGRKVQYGLGETAFQRGAEGAPDRWPHRRP